MLSGRPRDTDVGGRPRPSSMLVDAWLELGGPAAAQVKLKDAGIHDFVIFEKGADIGTAPSRIPMYALK